jgi:hypothetical protein
VVPASGLRFGLPVALALAALAQPAAARGPFGPAQTLARGARTVAVAVGDSGDAYVAWVGRDGIGAATRRPGRGFGRAQRLTRHGAIKRSAPALDADDRGHVALAWVESPAGKPALLRLAVAGRSGRFRRAAVVPTPASSIVRRQRPQVTYGRDGRIAVTWTAAPAGASPQAFAAIREVDGRWNPAVLMGQAASVPSAAVTGAGEILVTFAEQVGGRPQVPLFAAAPGAGELRRVTDLTPPSIEIAGREAPTVVGNIRGDA